jgi:hypothetical protein
MIAFRMTEGSNRAVDVVFVDREVIVGEVFRDVIGGIGAIDLDFFIGGQGR